MDVYQKQEFINHLGRLSNCLNATRQEICEALCREHILEPEIYADIAGFCKRMDALAKNKAQIHNR